MDFSLITAAATSLRMAAEIGSAALSLRDFNQLAGELAKMNGELLKAQQALFAHQTTLMEIQAKYAQATKELAQANHALQQRESYALFEIGAGKFVYRSQPVQAQGNSGVAVAGEPVHYLCQPCFDSGRKQVLQLFLNAADGPVAQCPSCKVFFNCEHAARRR